MNTLGDKFRFLKSITDTINSLENDINSLISQNHNLLCLKHKFEVDLKEINAKNEELIATKNELLNTLSKKDKELLTQKTELLNTNYVINNESTFSLGINNLSVRNTEAIHDALSFYDKKCPYCNEYLFVTTNRKQFEVDHFFPVVKGGQDVPWNLLPVCQSCNRKKKDSLPHIFLDTESFTKASNYLNNVHQNFLDEAIDSYTFKEKLLELINKESSFIKNHVRSEFITALLYLAESHNIIKEVIVCETHIEYFESDGLKNQIVEYLDKEIPENWKSLDIQKRRNFLGNDEIKADSSIKLHKRKFVCIAEIWCECLGMKKEEMDRYKTREINVILKNLDNWTQSTSTKNFAIYGTQKFYERKSFSQVKSNTPVKLNIIK